VLLINWFMSVFHLIGAVLVTMLGLVIAKSMAFVRLKNLMKVSFAQLLPWTNLGGILIATAIATLPSIFLTMQLRLPPIYFLPISGAVYMITYSILVLSFGLLTATEKQTIQEWLSRPFRLLTAGS